MGLTRQYAEKKKAKSSARHDDVPPVEEPQVKTMPPGRKAELLGDLDDLLDQIDEVLVENASEFVEAYVQKGGQ